MSSWRMFNSFSTAMSNEICQYTTQKEKNKWVLDNLNFAHGWVQQKQIEMLYIRLVCVKIVIF